MGNPARRSRGRTNAELIEALRESLDSLDHSIRAIDANEKRAIRSLAAELRLLLTMGEGNNLLSRVAERTQSVLPSIGITSQVARDPTVQLEVGAIPTNDEQHAEVVTLHEFTGAHSLAISDDAHYYFLSWDEVIRDIANRTHILHSPEEADRVLDEIWSYTIGNAPLYAFLLRSAGLVASQLGHHLLDAVDPNHQVLSHPDRPDWMLNIYAVSHRGILPERWQSEPNELLRQIEHAFPRDPDTALELANAFLDRYGEFTNLYFCRALACAMLFKARAARRINSNSLARATYKKVIAKFGELDDAYVQQAVGCSREELKGTKGRKKGR